MWITGIKLWHQVNLAPWRGGDCLRHAIEGASRSIPESSHLPKRDPVTLQHLQTLCSHLDLTTSFNVAIFAVACVAFWSCCRLGELLIDLDFDPNLHVSRSVPVKCGTAANGLPYCSFHIPSSKTKGSKGANIIISDSTCKCSAVTTFNHHLAANTKVPHNAPLFAFKTADGNWAPLRCSWFLIVAMRSGKNTI